MVRCDAVAKVCKGSNSAFNDKQQLSKGEATGQIKIVMEISQHNYNQLCANLTCASKDR